MPSFQLTSESGNVFESTAQLAGRIWVADFIFTNCQGPCPRMTSQMRRIQDATDARLVSFSVDPERDTPEVLTAYARRHNADPKRWAFLTGARSELHRLKREVFLLGNVDGQLNHSTRFILIDPHMRIRATYDTSEPDSVSRVIEDIAFLRREEPL